MTNLWSTYGSFWDDFGQKTPSKPKKKSQLWCWPGPFWPLAGAAAWRQKHGSSIFNQGKNDQICIRIQIIMQRAYISWYTLIVIIVSLVVSSCQISFHLHFWGMMFELPESSTAQRQAVASRSPCRPAPHAPWSPSAHKDPAVSSQPWPFAIFLSSPPKKWHYRHEDMLETNWTNKNGKWSLESWWRDVLMFDISYRPKCQGQEVGSIKHFQTAHGHTGIDVCQGQICRQLGIEFTSKLWKLCQMMRISPQYLNLRVANK